MNEMILNNSANSIPTSKMPELADIVPYQYEIPINITQKAFDGLARQGMLFHQAINELCDNALAAALPGEKARICVALAPDSDKNYLQLAVADWGRGMDLVALTNALQLGSQPVGDDRLNEHGYGLNNALACLAGAFSLTASPATISGSAGPLTCG